MQETYTCRDCGTTKTWGEVCRICHHCGSHHQPGWQCEFTPRYEHWLVGELERVQAKRNFNDRLTKLEDKI